MALPRLLNPTFSVVVRACVQMHNAPLDDILTNILAAATMFQHANVLAGAAAVYAPVYRQASMAIQVAGNGYNWGANGDDENPATDAAMQLALSDVEAAFESFLARRPAGPAGARRPFILAGHSQGTMHVKRMMARLPERHPGLLADLVVAYLVGNTVEEWEVPVPVCAAANSTGCFVSWNTVVEGGGAGTHWNRKARDGATVCVNPLTWEVNGTGAPRELHRGAVPVSGHLFLSSMPAGVVNASCGRSGVPGGGDDGILYVTLDHTVGWSYGPLEGDGRMHAFDFSLFWRNLRANVHDRVGAFFATGAADATGATAAQEPCEPCWSSPACGAGLLLHGIVAVLMFYPLVTAVGFVVSAPVYAFVHCDCDQRCCRRRDRRTAPFHLAVACACCWPCFGGWRCWQHTQRRRRQRRRAPISDKKAGDKKAKETQAAEGQQQDGCAADCVSGIAGAVVVPTTATRAPASALR
jgi:hypothetical protein